MYLNNLTRIPTSDVFDLSGQSGIYSLMARNGGKLLTANAKEHACFPLPLPCAVITFGNPESHLEGRGGLLMPPSHLSRRPTSHSTPRALQPFSERGSRAGAAAGPLHSGAHSRSVHLRRCTGTCSSAGRSLHFGK